MAEGGEIGKDNYPYYLDQGVDYSDDDDNEQEVNRTQPFKPREASTPYHGSEQVGMQTVQHEETGLPDTSYDEWTPLLETPSISEIEERLHSLQRYPFTGVFADPSIIRF